MNSLRAIAKGIWPLPVEDLAQLVARDAGEMNRSYRGKSNRRAKESNQAAKQKKVRLAPKGAVRSSL